MLNKQASNAKKILELIKKDSELCAKTLVKTDESVKEILAKAKAREEDNKKYDETIKEHHKSEAQRAFARIKILNKIISDNPNISSERREIINKLIKLHGLRETYYLNKVNNNSKRNKAINIALLNGDINELEKRLRDQEGSGMFTSQKEFVKLLTFLAQLNAGNNSKKFKNDINQLLSQKYYISQNK